jgi:hypothetical protein
LGEWKQRTHGKQKRRTWRKLLHLGVDSDTGLVTAVTLTDNTAHDGSQVEALLDETLTGETGEGESDEELSTVGANGAHDIWDVYEEITDREATPVIPPQKNAKIKKHGNSGGSLPLRQGLRSLASPSARRIRRRRWGRFPSASCSSRRA